MELENIGQHAAKRQRLIVDDRMPCHHDKVETKPAIILGTQNTIQPAECFKPESTIVSDNRNEDQGNAVQEITLGRGTEYSDQERHKLNFNHVPFKKLPHNAAVSLTNVSRETQMRFLCWRTTKKPPKKESNTDWMESKEKEVGKAMFEFLQDEFLELFRLHPTYNYMLRLRTFFLFRMTRLVYLSPYLSKCFHTFIFDKHFFETKINIVQLAHLTHVLAMFYTGDPHLALELQQEIVHLLAVKNEHERQGVRRRKRIEEDSLKLNSTEPGPLPVPYVKVEWSQIKGNGDVIVWTDGVNVPKLLPCAAAANGFSESFVNEVQHLLQTYYGYSFTGNSDLNNAILGRNMTQVHVDCSELIDIQSQMGDSSEVSICQRDPTTPPKDFPISDEKPPETPCVIQNTECSTTKSPISKLEVTSHPSSPKTVQLSFTDNLNCISKEDEKLIGSNDTSIRNLARQASLHMDHPSTAVIGNYQLTMTEITELAAGKKLDAQHINFFIAKFKQNVQVDEFRLKPSIYFRDQPTDSDEIIKWMEVKYMKLGRAWEHQVESDIENGVLEGLAKRIPGSIGENENMREHENSTGITVMCVKNASNGWFVTTAKDYNSRTLWIFDPFRNLYLTWNFDESSIKTYTATEVFVDEDLWSVEFASIVRIDNDLTTTPETADILYCIEIVKQLHETRRIAPKICVTVVGNNLQERLALKALRHSSRTTLFDVFKNEWMLKQLLTAIKQTRVPRNRKNNLAVRTAISLYTESPFTIEMMNYVLRLLQQKLESNSDIQICLVGDVKVKTKLKRPTEFNLDEPLRHSEKDFLILPIKCYGVYMLIVVCKKQREVTICFSADVVSEDQLLLKETAQTSLCKQLFSDVTGVTVNLRHIVNNSRKHSLSGPYCLRFVQLFQCQKWSYKIRDNQECVQKLAATILKQNVVARECWNYMMSQRVDTIRRFVSAPFSIDLDSETNPKHQFFELPKSNQTQDLNMEVNSNLYETGITQFKISIQNIIDMLNVDNKMSLLSMVTIVGILYSEYKTRHSLYGVGENFQVLNTRALFTVHTGKKELSDANFLERNVRENTAAGDSYSWVCAIKYIYDKSKNRILVDTTDKQNIYIDKNKTLLIAMFHKDHGFLLRIDTIAKRCIIYDSHSVEGYYDVCEKEERRWYRLDFLREVRNEILPRLLGDAKTPITWPKVYFAQKFPQQTASGLSSCLHMPLYAMEHILTSDQHDFPEKVSIAGLKLDHALLLLKSVPEGLAIVRAWESYFNVQPEKTMYAETTDDEPILIERSKKLAELLNEKKNGISNSFYALPGFDLQQLYSEK